MIVGVPREIYPGERRVALVHAVIPSLTKAGREVLIEAGSGVSAGYPDADQTAVVRLVHGQGARATVCACMRARARRYHEARGSEVDERRDHRPIVVRRATGSWRRPTGRGPIAGRRPPRDRGFR